MRFPFRRRSSSSWRRRDLGSLRSPFAGFTLVELLLVVSVIAILGGVAIIAVENTRESTRVSKLESDVATINAAIQVYRVNGGSLPASATPQAILDRLKTVASSASAAAMSGLRGSMIDRRMVAEMQTSGEAAAGRPRALWDGSAGRFVVASSGATGVRMFRLDESLAGVAPGTENRTATLPTTPTGWVWQYVEPTPPARPGPGATPATGNATGGTTPNPHTTVQLSPPLFSTLGGNLALINYDIPLLLSNPNPPGTSQIYFSVDAQPLALYGGQTITIPPGTSVRAYAVTSDPDNWSDSNLALHEYQTTPVTLELTTSFARTQYTFEQAGGAMVNVDPVTPAPATITLSDAAAAQIPAGYRTNAKFELRRTMDGTSALTSNSATVSGPFSGTVPTDTITISPDLWGTASSLSVQAVAASKSPWLVSSPVFSTTLAITKTTMPAPEFNAPGGTYFSDLPVALAFGANATYPANARIYYRTDGADPGVDASGNPQPGATLFAGNFTVLSLASPAATVIARAYGPTTYAHWFTPSGPTTVPYQLFLPPPWNGYIVGQFNTTVNSAFNGIQQLNESGSLDLTFNPGTGTGTGNSNSVRHALYQPDGKAIIVGDFTVYNGTPVNRIARLNEDGTLDTTFNVGTGFNARTSVVVVQPDGRILVGGDFTTYNGVARRNIARLNADGSLDTTFNPGTGTTGANNINPGVEAIAVQPDGKILIGGSFTSYNGASRRNLVRVNADGSIDSTFATGTGPSDRVHAVIVQPDGKVFIAGVFTSFNGTTRNRVARVNANGTLDTAFATGSGADKDLYAAALQPDGKFIIGGTMNRYDGVNRKGIARINADGSLDTTFDLGTGSGVGSYTILTISLQSDGGVVFGGDFPAYNPGSRANLVRVNTDGTFDDSFSPGELRPNTTVYATAVNGDDKILMGGDFTAATTTGLNNVARLAPISGLLDLAFNPGTGTNSNSLVWGLAEQDDGKIIIGGDFTTVDGRSRPGVARLNVDGSVDTSFNPGAGATGGGVWTVAVQTDGRIIIGGQFTRYNGTTVAGVARLLAGGGLDPSFSAGTGFNGYVSSSVVQDDGKIVIGGGFTTYRGVTARRIVRLNTDGSRDETVGNSVGVDDGQVNWVGLQPDGKILFGGSFTTVGGVSRRGIARLNADGTLDTGFASNNGIEGGSAINSFGLQHDGKIVIGGTFRTYGGVARPGIARINADGTLDTGFTPGQGPTAVPPLTPNVQSVIVQPDAKIIIAGSFSGYNGNSVNKIIRLNANGTYDSAFGSSTLSIKTINNTR